MIDAAELVAAHKAAGVRPNTAEQSAQHSMQDEPEWERARKGELSGRTLIATPRARQL